PESEFKTGRLPGARSVPLATLASRTDELPPDGMILLYGDASNERLFRAYHFIRARRGGAVYLLDGGIDGWRRVGYPLERRGVAGAKPPAQHARAHRRAPRGVERRRTRVRSLRRAPLVAVG